MMLLPLLAPLIASVLYVIVFQKAGFRGPMLAVAVLPLAGGVLSRVLFGSFYYGGPAMAVLAFIPMALSLAPLFVLAFMAWPPTGGSAGNSTENN